jgi:hypothetical protein
MVSKYKFLDNFFLANIISTPLFDIFTQLVRKYKKSGAEIVTPLFQYFSSINTDIAI